MTLIGPPRFIAIAGNMGTGKSTMVDFLCKYFNLKPFYEPHLENPFLADFYQDMKRWAFHSQLYFLVRRFKIHLELSNQDAPAILDRTIYEDAEVFARNLYRSRVMSGREYQIYREMYETLLRSLKPPDIMIYLRCSVKTIRKRIKERDRKAEAGIPAKYLSRLNHLYEAWYKGYDLSPKIEISTERLDYLSDMIYRVDLLEMVEKVIR